MASAHETTALMSEYVRMYLDVNLYISPSPRSRCFNMPSSGSNARNSDWNINIID